MSGKKSKKATPVGNDDLPLKEALVKAYSARARLFHGGVIGARMRDIFAEIDAFDPSGLDWNGPESIGIDSRSFERIKSKGISPHLVFGHPDILLKNPRLVAYYRNLVAISQKGMSQLGLPVARFERNQPSQMSKEVSLLLAQTFNRIISSVIENLPNFDLGGGRDVVFAEIGTELQGTWNNAIGKGASKSVEDMFARYLEREKRGSKEGPGKFILNNHWRIVFGTEPDILFTDPVGIEKIVIEIKGSLDRAGAQTRYGETKKSFAKSLKKNPRCYTIYLASCFTSAVSDQIKADGQVSESVNLTSVLYDPAEQERFLKRLFYRVDAPS